MLELTNVMEDDSTPSWAMDTDPLADFRNALADEPPPEPPPPRGNRFRAEPSPDSNFLISPQPAAMATAAFSQLTNRLQTDRFGSMPIGVGRTVEELIIEVLRPMLRDWLDQNLPSLVESMVKSEIDKIVKQSRGF
ncbi:conserved hypothetical protein [Azospirillaceae bacterium]